MPSSQKIRCVKCFVNFTYHNELPQKIQCTFKFDIPDMGHLGGGNERDVWTRLSMINVLRVIDLTVSLDQSPQQNGYTDMAGLYHALLVSGRCRAIEQWLISRSDWADFVIPTPFGAKVRNALKAEAKSVRLSSLVGAGGLWYGFGKIIMDMWADFFFFQR